MPALSYYSNVHNTALNILVDRGYQLWRDPETDAICAERDRWDFMADDPVQLLGIVSIFETLEPSECTEYWWRINEPWIADDLPTAPPNYNPIWRK